MATIKPDILSNYENKRLEITNVLFREWTADSDWASPGVVGSLEGIFACFQDFSDLYRSHPEVALDPNFRRFIDLIETFDQARGWTETFLMCQMEKVRDGEQGPSQLFCYAVANLILRREDLWNFVQQLREEYSVVIRAASLVTNLVQDLFDLFESTREHTENLASKLNTGNYNINLL